MAAKSSFEDINLITGPPYSGKSLYYNKHLGKDYQRICPGEIFQDNPDLGLRDICLRIYSCIKQKQKVAIEDGSGQKSTCQAYISAIKKKYPSCKMKLTVMKPLYGEDQCHWTRQLIMAAEPPDLDVHNKMHGQSKIHKWFQLDSALTKSDFNTDITIEQKCVPLTALTDHKLEVPVLFLQWEALNTDRNNHEPVAQLCQRWVEVNRCGRVIVICDGKNVAKGLLSQKEEDFAVKTFMQEVVKKVAIPIYVLQMTDMSKSSGFCQPPEPGILAFLQRRHHLDLHCRSSQYVYTGTSHRIMAERAGLRHIKIAQVMHHPNLLVSGHSSVTPRIPNLLKHISVESSSISSGDEALEASIPMYEHLDQLVNGQITVSLPGGRCEMVFAKDEHVFQDYQDDYRNSATRVEYKDSIIQSYQNNHLVKSKSVPSLPEVATLSSESSSGSTSSRDLPKWMLGRGQSSKSSLEKSESTSSTEGNARKKKTVYMMSEQELVETAKQVLKQGGREDLIEILEKRRIEIGNSTDHAETPIMKARAKSKACSKQTNVTDNDDIFSGQTLAENVSSRKRQPHVETIDNDSESPTKRVNSQSQARRHREGHSEIVGINDMEDSHVENKEEDIHVSRRLHVTNVLDSLFD